MASAGMWAWVAVTGGLIGALALVACGGAETGGSTTTGADTAPLGNGGDGGSGAGQGGGGGLVHDCDPALATDLTAHSVVNLTWSEPHHECVRVAVGTDVRWNGDFTANPLAGGEEPVVDASSPITLSAPVWGQVAVTFDTAGAYPYFSQSHPSDMRGVVFVGP